MPRARCIFLAVTVHLACSTSRPPVEAGSAAAPTNSAAAPTDSAAARTTLATAPKNSATAPADTTAPVATTAKAELGKPAPDFTLPDADGNVHRLSEHMGKLVVLEWFNPGCPFVKYAHGEGPLRDMASKEVASGVVWYAVNSGAVGKQGAGADASREGAKGFAMTHPILIDEGGAVGHAYAAEKTPHVFLIDPAGVLVYAGAIDNAPMGEVDGGGAYTNHLGAALADLRANRAVATPQTKAYGCSVKYAK